MKTFFTFLSLIGAILCGVSFFIYILKGKYDYGFLLSMFIFFIVFVYLFNLLKKSI